ncbi:MAG TPA: hypothetical protein VHN80_26720 [Kineosporiaceae bacterium]|nr:hypothetical protein [Kineosporiaceae bacterium]
MRGEQDQTGALRCGGQVAAEAGHCGLLRGVRYSARTAGPDTSAQPRARADAMSAGTPIDARDAARCLAVGAVSSATAFSPTQAVCQVRARACQA